MNGLLLGMGRMRLEYYGYSDEGLKTGFIFFGLLRHITLTITIRKSEVVSLTMCISISKR